MKYEKIWSSRFGGISERQGGQRIVEVISFQKTYGLYGKSLDIEETAGLTHVLIILITTV